ncbi:hypothetical protein RI367_001920 [Sorochytrium milnesiophthora]
MPSPRLTALKWLPLDVLELICASLDDDSSARLASVLKDNALNGLLLKHLFLKGLWQSQDHSIVSWLVVTGAAGAGVTAWRNAAEFGWLDVMAYLQKYHGAFCGPSVWDRAAKHGRLGVLRFLSSCRPRIEGCTQDGLQAAIDGNHADVVRYLVKHCERACTATAMAWALRYDEFGMFLFLRKRCGRTFKKTVKKWILGFCDLDMVQSLCCYSRNPAPPYAVVYAAAQGRLDVIKYLDEQGATGFSPEVMDAAAIAGHLDIVEYLHRNRHEGCTVNAMDGAAAAGHFEVVRFLHQHRQEGCKHQTFSRAAENGHVDVAKLIDMHYPALLSWWAFGSAILSRHLDAVRYLHATKLRAITSSYLTAAVQTGNLELIKFVFEHATNTPASWREVQLDGPLEVVQYVQETYGDRIGPPCLDYAACGGRLDVLLYMHTLPGAHCTAYAMNNAASRGYIDVVKFLHYTFNACCTDAALIYAARSGHLAVCHFLVTHRTEVQGSIMESFRAAVYGRQIDVAFYLLQYRNANWDLTDIIAHVSRFPITEDYQALARLLQDGSSVGAS